MSQRSIEKKPWTRPSISSDVSDFHPRNVSHRRSDSSSSIHSYSMISSNGRSLQRSEANYSDDGDEGYDEGSEKNSTPIKLDRYGFYISDPQSTQVRPNASRVNLVEIARKREIKWLFMFQRWDEFMQKKWKKIRNRCRKGIPDSVRGKAWFYLCAGHKQKNRNPDLFSYLDKHPGDEKINEEIRKDLNRQFPSHEMFAQENGPGQEDLYRILKAFSVIKPEIGYCQGQAPVASVLLMQMPAEDAFWCLLQICDHYVAGYFSPGLETIQLHGLMLSSFIKKFHPPIYRLFKKQKIDPVLYMTEWFMCFFSRTLKWSCVLRVWDMFFCEGIVVVFKVAIILIGSVLGRSEERAKCVSAYETLYALKNIPARFLSDEYLVEKVINFDLTDRDLRKEFTEQSLKREREKKKVAFERKNQSRTSISKNSAAPSEHRNES